MILKRVVLYAGIWLAFVAVAIPARRDVFAYESACGPECQARVEQKFNAAKQLERQGDHEGAAQLYAGVIAEEPLSLLSQDAAIRAALGLEKAGKPAEAVPFYETAISIADARSSEPGGKGVLIKRRKRDALFYRAGALQKAGATVAATAAYKEAVDTVFADLSAEVASSSMRQDSAVNLQQSGLEAAVFLEEHGDPDRATVLYDHVIAIGDARGDTADGENIALILNAKRDALLRKAGICQREGCADEALTAIQRIRWEFPVSPQVAEAAIIEAKLNNWPTDPAESQLAREQQAQAALAQATTVVAMDAVISQYPDTVAAIAALERKARLKESLKQIDEAEAAYFWVLDRLRPVAPRSEIFQTTRVRLKRLISEHLIKEKNEGGDPPGQKWDELRSLCWEIINNDTRPDEQAQTYVTIAESYAWQEQHEQSLSITQQMLAQYDPKIFPSQTAWAKFYAGAALQGLKRYPEAMIHYRGLLEQPNIAPDTPLGKKLFPALSYRITKTLEITGVSPADAQRYVDEWVQRRQSASNP